jgi:hypothetical protein
MGESTSNFPKRARGCIAAHRWLISMPALEIFGFEAQAEKR